MKIKYECCNCGKLFNTMNLCLDHESKCRLTKENMEEQWKAYSKTIKSIDNEVY